MTAKEQVLVEAPDWTEEQAQRALRAAHGPDRVDEWGDLDAQAEALFSDSINALAEEERAAGFGPWREPKRP